MQHADESGMTKLLKTEMASTDEFNVIQLSSINTELSSTGGLVANQRPSWQILKSVKRKTEHPQCLGNAHVTLMDRDLTPCEVIGRSQYTAAR